MKLKDTKAVIFIKASSIQLIMVLYLEIVIKDIINLVTLVKIYKMVNYKDLVLMKKKINIVKQN